MNLVGAMNPLVDSKRFLLAAARLGHCSGAGAGPMTPSSGTPSGITSGFKSLCYGAILFYSAAPPFVDFLPSPSPAAAVWGSLLVRL